MNRARDEAHVMDGLAYLQKSMNEKAGRVLDAEVHLLGDAPQILRRPGTGAEPSRTHVNVDLSPGDSMTEGVEVARESTSAAAESSESIDGSWRFFAVYAVVGPLALSVIALLWTGLHPAVLWLYVTLALAAGLLSAIIFAIEARGALPASIRGVPDRWWPSGSDWYFVSIGTVGFLLASVPLFVSAPSSTPSPVPLRGPVPTPFAWSTGALIAGVVAGLIGVLALAAGGAASLRRRRASIRARTSPASGSAAGNGGKAKGFTSVPDAYDELLQEVKTEYDSATQAANYWRWMNVALAFFVALLSGAAGITSIISGTPSSVRLVFAVLGILGAALAALSVSIAAGQRHGAMASRAAQLRAFQRSLSFERLNNGQINVEALKNNGKQFDQILANTDPDTTANTSG